VFSNLIGYLFLKLSKIDISKNLKSLDRIPYPRRVSTESKRNRRMIKMKTIDVRLMAYSFSGK